MATGKVRPRRSKAPVVAVTGAASGAGRLLAARLAEREDIRKVVAIDGHRGDVTGATWRVVDIRDPLLSNRLSDVDVIVNLDVEHSPDVDGKERRTHNVRGAQTVVTAAAGADAWDGTFTLVASDGTKTEVTATGTGPQDLAKAINAAKAGVVATVVPAGTDAGGTPLSRIQLTATETGAEGSFTLYRGTEAEVTAGTATDVATDAGAAVRDASAGRAAAAGATTRSTSWPRKGRR